MTGTTNIDELINLLNISDTILRFNIEVENTIKQNSGTIVYSFNNIIIASEINDSLFKELLKSPYIDYIQDLPLKSYGDIDSSLIGQLDPTKINLDIVDGVYGDTSENGIQNIENGVSVGLGIGTAPRITNLNLALSALTNEWFDYQIYISGSIPINLQYVPINYEGNLELTYDNKLSGKTSVAGIYEITLRATNNYGFDIKTLILTILDPVKIINTDLLVYNKIGTIFNYTILTSGTPPIIYNVINIPPNLTLTNNIISGVFSSGGTGATYNMTIVVSGTSNSDSKDITLITGSVPIITSSGDVECEQYADFTYTVTSTGTLPITYNILGIMPTGLQFKVDTISGIPIYDGIYNLKIKATNAYGESIKDLRIFVNYMATSL